MSRPNLSCLRSVPALLTFGLTALIGLGVDLWTKRLAFDHLAPFGIEQVDEVGQRQGALQVVPNRLFPSGTASAIGIQVGPGGSTSSSPGVVIEQIGLSSPAGKATPVGDTDPHMDLDISDRIVAVNNQPVTTPAEVEAKIVAEIAALNRWYESPAANRPRERAEPAAPRGIDLRVIKPSGRQGTFRIKPAEQALQQPCIPGFLQFQALVNQGAVFGIGQGQRFLFLVVSTLAICFILYLFATSGRHRFYQFVLGMLLAGVIGNMYDRLYLGFVRDMIHALPGRKWLGTEREIFPWIFNVADSLLCVGVGLIFLYTLKGSPATRDRKEPAAAKPATAEG
jgi:signal peptidase II